MSPQDLTATGPAAGGSCWKRLLKLTGGLWCWSALTEGGVPVPVHMSSRRQAWQGLTATDTITTLAFLDRRTATLRLMRKSFLDPHIVGGVAQWFSKISGRRQGCGRDAAGRGQRVGGGVDDLGLCRIGRPKHDDRRIVAFVLSDKNQARLCQILEAENTQPCSFNHPSPVIARSSLCQLGFRQANSSPRAHICATANHSVPASCQPLLLPSLSLAR